MCTSSANPSTLMGWEELARSHEIAFATGFTLDSANPIVRLPPGHDFAVGFHAFENASPAIMMTLIASDR